MLAVTVIPQKELRNNVAEVLRRAEAGEEFTITVAGRPLAAARPHSTAAMGQRTRTRRVWDTPAPQTLTEHLERFPGGLGDPFA